MSTPASPVRIPSERIPPGCIVVGVDGSPEADRAIAWAASQAALENRALVLLHSSDVGSSLDAYVGVAEPQIEWTRMRRALEATADAILTRADHLVSAAHHPGLETISVLSRRDPREVLLAVSELAHLLVVGSHGAGRFADLVLGSVTTTVAARSTCPTVVLGPTTSDNRPTRVLVGARFAPGSAPVVEHAFAQASLRGLPLIVAHCYDGAGRESMSVSHDLADQREQLSQTVAGLGEKYPDVRLRLDLMFCSFHDLVTHSTDNGELVVVGRRTGSLPGRVSGAWSTLGIVADAAASGVAVVVVPETAT